MKLIKRALIQDHNRLHLKKLVLLTLSLCLCACSPGTPFKPASNFSRDTTVFDFRLSSFIGSAAIPEYPDALFVKQAVYGTGFPDTLHVGIPVKGHFTVTSEIQSVYLITRSDMRRGMLAVFSHAPDNNKFSDKKIGRILGQFVLDEPYLRLLGAQDINGDGFDELIFLQDAFQMGVQLQSIDIMSIANMQRTLVAQEQFVLENSCDSAQHENVIRASRLEFSPGSIQRDNFVADCVDDDDAAEPFFKLVD
ncbi:MAG: hypothetical protein AB8B79_09320 [Granulosicoccus sp.]